MLWAGPCRLRESVVTVWIFPTISAAVIDRFWITLALVDVKSEAALIAARIRGMYILEDE